MKLLASAERLHWDKAVSSGIYWIRCRVRSSIDFWRIMVCWSWRWGKKYVLMGNPALSLHTLRMRWLGKQSFSCWLTMELSFVGTAGASDSKWARHVTCAGSSCWRYGYGCEMELLTWKIMSLFEIKDGSRSFVLNLTIYLRLEMLNIGVTEDPKPLKTPYVFACISSNRHELHTFATTSLQYSSE